MDDFYLIHENREYLKYCMEEIRKKCKEYGFVLNEKKTKKRRCARESNS